MRFLGLSSFHPDPGISAWYEESAACQFPRIAARLIDTEHVLKLLEDYPAGLAQLQITDNMIPYHIISYHNIIYIYYLDKLYHSSIKVFFYIICLFLSTKQYQPFFEQTCLEHILLSFYRPFSRATTALALQTPKNGILLLLGQPPETFATLS